MVTEKNQKLKTINIITWLIMAGVTLAAYFMPLNKLNVLQMELNHPGPLVGPALVWYLFFIALISLGMFIWYQTRSTAHQELVRAKTRQSLGWTAGGSFLLYALSIVLWHFEFLGWATFTLILTALVLFIANGNIREDGDVMMEKFWVRNPFSFFLGWVLYLLMNTIAMRWETTFSQELPAVILLLIFLALVIYFSFHNLNLGVPIVWTAALALKLFENQAPQILQTVLWIGGALLILSIILIARKGPHAQYYRKPAVRAMDKYNSGLPSQLEALEEELNAQLQVKPGARITFK